MTTRNRTCSVELLIVSPLLDLVTLLQSSPSYTHTITKISLVITTPSLEQQLSKTALNFKQRLSMAMVFKVTLTNCYNLMTSPINFQLAVKSSSC